MEDLSTLIWASAPGKNNNSNGNQPLKPNPAPKTNEQASLNSQRPMMPTTTPSSYSAVQGGFTTVSSSSSAPGRVSSASGYGFSTASASGPSAFAGIPSASPNLSTKEPRMSSSMVSQSTISGNSTASKTGSLNSMKGKDAFESLVSFGSDKKEVDIGKLSLAEQQKVKAQASLVNSAPSLVKNQVVSPAAESQKAAPSNFDAWNFEAILSVQSTATQKTTTNSGHGDELSAFLSGKPAPVSSPVKQPEAPAVSKHKTQAEELDVFQSVTSVPPRATTPSPASVEKDVAKPKEPVRQTAETAPQRPPSVPQKNESKNKDELVARLVDAGFGVEEATRALEMTNFDMTAAAEGLLSGKFSATSANEKKKSDVGAKISKLTGLSDKHAQKAGQILTNATDFGKSLFQKAKVLVADSTKKIATVIDEQNTRGGMGQRLDDEDDYNPQFDGQRSFESFGQDIPVSSVEKATVEAPQAPLKKKRSQSPVQCSPDILGNSEKLKEIGNDFTKKGQYGDAEESYTKAIDLLPPAHLNLIALKNNRAAARLKIGKNKECLVDCSDVEALIIPELEYDDVDAEQLAKFKDALSKAYLRRATAYEALEKWEDAIRDYKKTLEVSPGARSASDGVRRCTQNASKSKKGEAAFEAPKQTDSLAGSFASASTAVPVATNPLEDLAFLAAPQQKQEPEFKSERVEELRAKEQRQNEEDAEKLRLKDEVDAKLNAWRLNKKDNIRGLIASLDIILWPDLRAGWKTVNMSELVTPIQVKKRYTMAIAKLHPDKLSNMPLTVEQKLLANGIFSTLNDAWEAFKVQNNIN